MNHRDLCLQYLSFLNGQGMLSNDLLRVLIFIDLHVGDRLADFIRGKLHLINSLPVNDLGREGTIKLLQEVGNLRPDDFNVISQFAEKLGVHRDYLQREENEDQTSFWQNYQYFIK